MPKGWIICGEADEQILRVKDLDGFLVDGTVCTHYFFVEMIGVAGGFKTFELWNIAGLATDH